MESANSSAAIGKEIEATEKHFCIVGINDRFCNRIDDVRFITGTDGALGRDVFGPMRGPAFAQHLEIHWGLGILQGGFESRACGGVGRRLEKHFEPEWRTMSRDHEL